MAQNKALSVKNIIYLVDMSLSRQSRKPGHLHALRENQRQYIQDLFIFKVGILYVNV